MHERERVLPFRIGRLTDLLVARPFPPDAGPDAVGSLRALSHVVSARVREGVSFSSALEARGVFPEVAVKMAEVGESTGALQEMLNTVADFYDEEISTNMERFVTLVEPVLLVIMGMVIAGLLLALYMPLFQLSSVLAG